MIVTCSSLISMVAGASMAIVAGPEIVSVFVSISALGLSVLAFLAAGAVLAGTSSSSELSELDEDELGAAFRLIPPCTSDTFSFLAGA